MEIRDQKPKARSRLLAILAGVLMLVLAGGVAVGIMTLSPSGVGAALTEFVISQLDSAPSTNPSPVPFEVKQGDTAADVAASLYRQGLIENAFLFRQLARVRGLDQTLKPGQYVLRRNMTMSEILADLQEASAGQNMMTTLEGWRASQIIDEMEFRGLGTRSELLALMEPSRWPHEFLAALPPGATIEGYLFPDSYAVLPDSTAEEVIGRALDNFERKVMPVWQEHSASTSLSLHEVITLASIVEREARLPEERATIAAVFLNRLEAGMPLQADPTVQYALVSDFAEPTEGYWKEELTLDDLAVESPYNTYVNAGLPPGPICNPGLPSIEAVLEPAETDYLYFVARGDGSHAFAETLEEHNENVLRYRHDQPADSLPE